MIFSEPACQGLYVCIVWWNFELDAESEYEYDANLMDCFEAGCHRNSKQSITVSGIDVTYECQQHLLHKYLFILFCRVLGYCPIIPPSFPTWCLPYSCIIECGPLKACDTFSSRPRNRRHQRHPFILHYRCTEGRDGQIACRAVPCRAVPCRVRHVVPYFFGGPVETIGGGRRGR